MADGFLHGVEVIELDDGPRPIRTVKSSVIGIVGTAPNADPEAFPLNTPVLISGSLTFASKLDTVVGIGLGTASGTLPNALDLIFDQIGAAVVVIRVGEEDTEEATLANVIGGVDVDGHYTGVHALLSAQSVLGIMPRILVSPGFTHSRSVVAGEGGAPDVVTANPVVAELVGIAERLRAVIIADGPNTTDAAAIAYAGDFGSKRVYVVDPFVRVQRGAVVTTEPASAAIAGLIAKIDNDKGFWWSPSNNTINGIVGTARAIDFALGDSNSRANLLNAENVATIIREDGFRLWGNRTLSSDPKYAFLSVVRTADMINDSILRAHMWAVDRNITKTYLDDVTEGVNAYLRSLKMQGAVLGGVCWPDPDLNTPESIANGQTWFNFDFTPPYPAERVSFRSRITNDYLEDLV